MVTAAKKTESEKKEKRSSAVHHGLTLNAKTKEAADVSFGHSFSTPTS